MVTKCFIIGSEMVQEWFRNGLAILATFYYVHTVIAENQMRSKLKYINIR